MKRIILSLSCLAILGTTKAQLIPEYQMQAINNTQATRYLSSTMDNSGNVYALGYADPNTDIDPGIGVLSSGATVKRYITKYDPATQTLLWSTTYTIGGFPNNLNQIAINSLNEVFCVGSVNSAVDLDPGPGTAYVTGSSVQAVIIKYSAAGTYMGYKQLNGSIMSRCSSIYIDATDKIYIGGAAGNTINFDYGATNYTLSVSNSDFFMASYNSDLSFNWATTFGTAGDEDDSYLSQIQTDGLGNTYAACKANGAGTIAGTSLVNLNEFVVKRNTSGVISDCFLFDVSSGLGNIYLKLNVCNNGKFFIAGGFKGTIDFDPTAGLLSKTSYTFGTAPDQFVGFYNNNGSPNWLHVFSNYISEVFYAAGIDSQKNIFVWGNYDHYNDYDPGSGITIFPNTSPIPHYAIESYDSLGNFRGGRTFMNGIDPNYKATLKSIYSGAGIMFMGSSGSFGATVDYAPGPPTTNLPAFGTNNGFITTYDFCLSSIQTTVNPSICSPSSYTLPSGTVVSSAGTYTSPLKSYWGCDSLIFTNLSVNPSPTLAISPTTSTICAGTPTLLNATGATTYTWNGTVNSNSLSISPTATTIYTLQGTIGACSATLTKTITTVANPTVSANSGTICSGKTFTIVPTGAASYTYSSGTTTVSPTSNTTYTITGATAGCTNIAVSSVSVKPTPTITALSGNTLICQGQPVTLTAGGASTYTWTGGITTSTLLVTPTITTTYTLVGTNSVSCTNSITITQSVSLCTDVINNTLNESNVNIYPNPVNDELTVLVEQLHGPISLQLINTLGEIIISETTITSTTKINTQQLSSGIYFLNVIQEKRKQIIKFIKQ